jgi:RHS repeat-associated protein
MFAEDPARYSRSAAASQSRGLAEVSAPAAGKQPEQFGLKTPTVSLPKGGGALGGIGEKYSANPVTGTGALSIPLPISPGRGGSMLQLSLRYDSGSGNGPFGMGWSLAIPSITRKTDKGLPRYLDSVDSDVFVLAGAEDLVPCDEAGDSRSPRLARVAGQSYRIRRYRPRVEGLFALIERWTDADDSRQTFWRVVDRSNRTQWFGRTAASRIADPSDPTRIFQWLLCEDHDDKGNAVRYDHVADDDVGVDLINPWEAHRSVLQRSAQRYLKRVRYGNRTPYVPGLHPDEPTMSLPEDWLFDLVFDYGDHRTEDPDPDPDQNWAHRHDAFSSHRAGFELRIARRCQRVLMFHRIAEAPEVGPAGLVRSMVFRYEDSAMPEVPLQRSYSTLACAQVWAHERYADGVLHSRPLPPLEFTYSHAVVHEEVHALAATDLPGLPVGIHGAGYQWVDLDGEGLSGVLAEEAGAWRYAANLGGGRFGHGRVVAPVPARRALAQGGQRLIDLDGNGALDVAEFSGPTPGFYERRHHLDEDWKAFVPFVSLPHIRWDDPNLRFIDLSGDGYADALVTEDDVFVWYPSMAEQGFGAAELARPPEGELGTRLVFADGTQTLFLADMCGDGLADIVRIRNAEVCYWPNLGYGRFGAKVRMGNSPEFDHDDLFDPRRIRLADIDGSGPTDLVYLGRSGAQLYFNRSGNSFSDARSVPFPLATLNLEAVQIVDLLGRGTACLVWNSHLPADSDSPLRYIDLMGGIKPHLLIETRNNLGGSTQIEYTPSTYFYLADKAAGAPWITRLPFPVQCVSRVTVRDVFRGTAFSSNFSYHHGYFDGIEREFRGFGRVEQTDIEDYGTFEGANANSPWITPDRRLYQPPVRTITWFHTGVALDRARVLAQFADEYFPARYKLVGAFRERALPEPELEPGLSTEEWREALRACKDMVLRQEVYELSADALTGPALSSVPVRIFSAATHNCRIQRLQPRGAHRHAVFLVTESEALTYQYEQALPEPGGSVLADPRISHSITLRVDEVGQPLQTVAIGYPRVVQHEDPALDEDALQRIRAVQAERHLAYAEGRFTADVLLPAAASADAALRHHRLRLPFEALSYELAGIAPAHSFYFQLQDFAALRLSDHYPPLNASTPSVEVAALPYHLLPDGATPQRRLIEHLRTLYFDDASDADAPTRALPSSQHGPRGLKYEDYKLALTDDLLAAVFVSPASLPSQPADMLAWELRPGVSARSLLDDPFISGYQHDAASSSYWMRSGIAGFPDDAAQHFFLPERYTDSFGAVTTLEFDPLDLYVRSVTDARGNRSEVLRFDHRALAPLEMVDANGNHTEACIDILGRVIASAAKGKPVAGEWEGDDLAAFASDAALRNPATADVHAFCSATTLGEAQARTWLARATSRFVYHFGEARNASGEVIAWATRPAMACGIAREIHASQPDGAASPLQVTLQCSDGGGKVLMAKQQAEPEADRGPLRWIVNGLTVLNNKGKPVKQYEPFFSADFGCELPREEGVTSIISYDAAGRVVRTDAPDGTFSRVEFSPWHTRHFDASDTVLESAWYVERGSPNPAVPLRRGVDGKVLESADFRAAWLAAKLANTPGQTHLDSLGREVVAIAHNRTPDEAARPMIEWSVADWGWKDEFHLTHTKLDAEGKPLWVRDARGNLVMQYIHPRKPDNDPLDALPTSTVPTYDIAGNLLYQHSMDAGDRWSLDDAAGQPLLAWDVNDALDADGQPRPEARLAHTEYDRLHRPTRQWLRLGTARAVVVERFDYRDTADTADGSDVITIGEARARNLIGQAIRHEDPSGRMELLRIGFTGQVQHEERRLARHTTARTIDWGGDGAAQEALLETETFIRQTRHDALGRMVLLANWHRDANRVAVYLPQYSRRGVLQAEELSIGAQWNDGRPSGGRQWTAVHGITYNAKGQHTRLKHGNGTETRYDYDPRSFRLTQLLTTRPATDLPFPGFRSNLTDERVVQQLLYTYDAAGNITEIEDQAWAPVFFRNQSVESRNLHVYDAMARLIEATGRESAELSGAPHAGSLTIGIDAFPAQTADHALRNYRQRYMYDAVGNFITMQHMAGAGSWTRHYETATGSNRLLRTWTGADRWEDTTASNKVSYAYDTHGSMLNLASVADADRIRWDWRDMIEGMDLGGGGRAWYAYDIGKQRNRKRIGRLGGEWEERLYLGGAELYRRYSPNAELVEEIETHHLFVDDQRILLVDDVIRTDSTRLGEGVLCKYQYSNRLGSVALELSESAQIVGCEELHPYGTTAYHMRGLRVRATAKRYRYTGMERDEESGLSYHSARYYLSWLGKWGSADPLGTLDGPNVFQYAVSSPLRRRDCLGTQASIAGPEEFRDPGRRADASAWFASRGYEIHHWDAEERLWRVLPRIDGSIGGMSMRGTGSTGGSTPPPVPHTPGPAPGTDHGGAREPVPGLDDLGEESDDPLEGILDDPINDSLPSEGSHPGRRPESAGGSAAEGSSSGLAGSAGADEGGIRATELDAAVQLNEVLDPMGDRGSEEGRSGGVPGGGTSDAEGNPWAQVAYLAWQHLGMLLIGTVGSVLQAGRRMNWGAWLRNLRPTSMPSVPHPSGFIWHAHHIARRHIPSSWAPRYHRMGALSRRYLSEVGIHPDLGSPNLIFGPNAGHSMEELRRVWSALRRYRGDRAGIEGALRGLGARFVLDQ